MDRAATLPVSVVLPVFRAGPRFERAWRSVAAQTRPPAELIVVDDASDDDTPAQVAALATQPCPFAVRVLHREVNGGAGEARNTGWADASAASRWVGFLDADDEWMPEKLAHQVAWLEAHPDFAWAALRCTWEGAAAASCGRPRLLTPGGLLWRNEVATPTVLVPRATGLRFRVGWRRCEDFLLWQDLLAAGLRGVLLPEPLVRLGRAPASLGGLTGDLRAMHAAERAALQLLQREGRLGAFTAVGWRLWLRVKYLRRCGRRALTPVSHRTISGP